MLNIAEAMARFAPFEPNPVLAIAVSGGPDSMALLVMAHEWACAQHGHVVALTVDHQLRAAAHTEAQQVAAFCKGRGIDHHILPWTGTKPETGVQNQARRARYDLLAAFCQQKNILHVLTAHHADDQRETILMRLQRKSGVDGLAGIAPEYFLSHLRVLRPLLAWRKDDLINYCMHHHVPFSHDPSNDADINAVPERSRLRALLPALDALGMDTPSLVQFGYCARLLAALQHDDMHAALAASIRFEADRPLIIVQRDVLSRYDDPVQKRVLRWALHAIGGGPYAPSPGSVAAMQQAVSANRSHTLHRCLVRPKHNQLFIQPECGFPL